MITRSQMALLLGEMSFRDNRKIDESIVVAWHKHAEHLDLADAREAITRWYDTNRERMMPADLRACARAVREERNRREKPHEVRQLPSRFETDADRAERIGRGLSQCREVLTTIRTRLDSQREPAATGPISPSDLIRERALGRLRADQEANRPGRHRTRTT